MTANKISRIWEELLNSKQDNREGLILRKISSNGIHLGLNKSNNQKIILIELGQEEIKKILLAAPTWKGIKFQKFQLDKTRNAIFLELTLKDFGDIFELICIDIIENTENANPQVLSRVINEVLAKWRLFFDKNKSSWLSIQQQKGLFGELYTLKNIISKEVGPKKAMDAWVGPLKKDHDFGFDNGDLEIKTTSSKEHRKINIPSETQLDNSGLDFLYLGVVSLLESKSQGISLKIIVSELRVLFKGDIALLKKFEDLLVMIGYLDMHDIHYDEEMYLVRNIDFYIVKKGFPRITELPEGIGDIKYSVMLSSCSDYLVNEENVVRDLMK